MLPDQGIVSTALSLMAPTWNKRSVMNSSGLECQDHRYEEHNRFVHGSHGLDVAEYRSMCCETKVVDLRQVLKSSNARNKIGGVDQSCIEICAFQDLGERIAIPRGTLAYLRVPVIVAGLLEVPEKKVLQECHIVLEAR